MRRIVKIACWIVAVILVLALTAPMLLRGKIAEIVKREANEMLVARLDFDKLNISLLRHFPHASVELRSLTLVGTERFEGDTIVAADRISVVVNLMSLFGDEGYEVTKVILARPAVHARKMADGAVNWDVMRPAEPADEAPAVEEATSEPSSFRLQVRDLRIDDAVIRYEDDSSNMRMATAPLSLRLRGDLAAERSDLSLRLLAGGLTLRSGGIPLLGGAEAELKATIAADLANNRYTISRGALRLNAIEVTLDGWAQLSDDAIGLDLVAGCDDVRFKEVLSLIPAFYTREFRNLAASGELSLGLRASGELRGAQLPAFELTASVRDGSFQYASLPKAVSDINVDLRVANPGGTMDRTEVDLSRFGLRMAGNSVAATFYATRLASDPTFRFTADGRVDLGSIREVYPLEKGTDLAGTITADLKVAGSRSTIERGLYDRMSASGTLVVEGVGFAAGQLPELKIRRAAATITPQAMTLGEFGLTVGRSDLAASGQLTGYLNYLLHGGLLSGRLYVKSDLLDLNELMAALPASAEAPAEAAKQSDADPAGAVVIPANLNLALNADFKQVLFQKMHISDISGGLSLADGALSLNGLGMNLFEGKATASGRYSTAADPQHPDLDLKMAFTGASFSKTFEELDFVQQLVPVFAKTGGNYSLSMSLRTKLDAAMSPELATLDGQGEIRSEHIHVQNLEVFGKLADALKNDKLRKIEARDVAIRFAIREGRIHTEPFDLKLAGINVNMSGSTGLDQTIDYTARVALPAGAAGGVLQNIGVGIGGTFSSPKITLGVKEAAEEAVKNIVDEQIGKLTGGASLSEEVAKRAAKLREEAEAAGAKLVAAAEAQRTKLVEAAEPKGKLAKAAAQKAGDKLVAEAQKQAEQLKAEAERQIGKLEQKGE